jgi:hypothetical protein
MTTLRWPARGAAAAIVMLTLASASIAQSASGRASGVIIGIVEDSAARPLSGADVSFAGYGLRTNTDSLGRFRIVNVPDGRFTMIVRGIGFRPAVNEIDVGSNDTLRLTFALERTSQELRTVLVRERTLSPRLQEFEDRRKLGFGKFFARADIEKINPVSVSDVLRRALALRVSRTGETVGSSRYGCATPIYVDGVAVGPGDLTQAPSPGEIAAIEVYAGPSTVPVWLAKGTLGSNSGCGAILIWTRDGSG